MTSQDLQRSLFSPSVTMECKRPIIYAMVASNGDGQFLQVFPQPGHEDRFVLGSLDLNATVHVRYLQNAVAGTVDPFLRAVKFRPHDRTITYARVPFNGRLPSTFHDSVFLRDPQSLFSESFEVVSLSAPGDINNGPLDRGWFWTKSPDFSEVESEILKYCEKMLGHACVLEVEDELRSFLLLDHDLAMED